MDRFRRLAKAVSSQGERRLRNIEDGYVAISPLDQVIHQGRRAATHVDQRSRQVTAGGAFNQGERSFQMGPIPTHLI
jgi:hypothetical protein